MTSSSTPASRARFSPMWFGVTHPVPANLLMLGIIGLGLLFGTTLRREMFPEIRPNRALISAVYPGASPSEIVQGLILKIEDKVEKLDEVEEIVSTAVEGVGTVMIEFRRNIQDIDDAVNVVKAALDTLTDLPEGAERLRTSKFEPVLPVISVSIFGDAEESELKRAAQAMRDDLRSLPGMSEIQIRGVRVDEIVVEIQPGALLRYQISLPEVADLIEQWMEDVPGGTVRTDVQSVRIRTMGTEERASTIRDIVIKSTPAGGVVRLGEIASVREGFVDVAQRSRINGKPAVSLTAVNLGNQDTIMIAEMVRSYAAGRTGQPFERRLIDRLYDVANAFGASRFRRATARQEAAAAGGDDSVRTPAPPREFASVRKLAFDLGASRTEPLPGELVLHNDLARFIEGRLDLLLRNAVYGGLLVFVTLLLFLNVRVAIWVMVGLVTSLLGTLALMAALDVTLNLLTMFGLIIVLGLLVDDAIVVAENIVHRHEDGEPALAAAINGARQIAWPVVATVLTSIAAFLPLRLVEGQMGDFLGYLPIVVSCALAVSLIEALVILPAHMGHSLVRRDNSRPGRLGRAVRSFENARDRWFSDQVIPAFGRCLSLTLRHRYVAVSIAVALWIVSLGLVAGGRAEFTFFPTADSEIFVVDLRMPVGTSITATSEVITRVEQACLAQEGVRTVETMVGNRLDTNDWAASTPQTHLAQLYVELESVETRTRMSSEIIKEIRSKVAGLTGVSSLRFEEIQGGPGGQALNLAVWGDDQRRILEVVELVKARLTQFKGVFDISDDADLGQRELQIRLRDGAAALGLTSSFVARQIRGAVFGLEPHTFSSNREDVDVRVMLDETSRRSLSEIENLYIFTPSGERVPLMEIADISERSGYSAIHRLNRSRVVTVLADVNQDINNPERVVAEMRPWIAELAWEYPDIRVEARGRQIETQESLRGIQMGFLVACLAIYVILAWLFGSYFQPLAVMLAIPFSMIGMIWGHMLLGYEIMILSLIGFVALTGIVVNDSLLLMEFYNHRRREGIGVRQALVEAGMRRLRPICLTTITTVLGLLPLMAETSFQAKFLIPMAISISFGLISATGLILLVLPCLILIGEDLSILGRWLWTGKVRVPSDPVAD